MKNKQTIIIASTIILTAVAGFGLFRFLPPTAQAFNPQPEPPGFGMIGITQGQTIRISAVNTNLPDSNIPPDPVRVTLNFRNADGELLRNANGNPISRTVQPPAGKSTSIDLNGDDFARQMDNSEIEGVKYSQITTVLVNAVNQQQTQIENEQTQIENLQDQLKKQQATIDGLRKIVCSQNTQAEVCREEK